MHKPTSRIIGLIITLSLSTATALLAKEATPAGSFLRYRANTVAELKNQIQTDSVAQARYAAHFGVSAKDMLKTINSGVRLVSLNKPTFVEMWYVNKKGVMSKKIKLLPKGSHVFATNTGALFLAWSCGNPLRASLPARQKMASGSKNPLEKTIETKVLPGPLEVVSTAAITAPPSMLAEITPTLAATAPVTMAPTLGVAATPAVASFAPALVRSGGQAYNLGWLAGLAALTSRQDSQPVPEPSSLFALVTGVGSILTIGGRRMIRRK